MPSDSICTIMKTTCPTVLADPEGIAGAGREGLLVSSRELSLSGGFHQDLHGHREGRSPLRFQLQVPNAKIQSKPPATSHTRQIEPKCRVAGGFFIYDPSRVIGVRFDPSRVNHARISSKDDPGTGRPRYFSIIKGDSPYAKHGRPESCQLMLQSKETKQDWPARALTVAACTPGHTAYPTEIT